KPGDTVLAYCRKPVMKDGCYAEFVAIPQGYATRKPDSLTYIEAAALPLSGLTAFQCLFDAVGLKAGETILIHAAAGGVGSYAVQLAKDCGAQVIGSASRKNHDYVRALGADEAIDYTAEDFRVPMRRLHPEGVDVVFDCVGGDTLTRSPDVLKKKGRLVSILDAAVVNQIKETGVDAHYVFVSPSGQQLGALAAMASHGRLKINVTTVLQLEQAAKAHEMIESNHTRGKIVLDVA
ncbi:MAG: NADP-dependent oxidoreductase, partial [Lentisphaerota bacterium]